MPAALGEDVRVTQLDGAVATGKLAAIRADAIELATSSDNRTVPMTDLMEIDFPQGAPITGEKAECTAFLVGDGRLHGKLVDGGEGWIELQGIAGRVRLPFDALEAIEFNRADLTPEVETMFNDALAAEDRTADLLIASAGTEEAHAVSGVAQSLDPQEGRFLFGDRVRKVRTSRVRAIVFAHVGSTKNPAASLCFLTSGDVLPGHIQAADSNALEWQGPFGTPIKLPLKVIRLITFQSDRLVYLSDLEPSSVASSGIIRDGWPLRRDRNAFNEPLVLGGRDYAKGLGAHARSEVHYNLDDQYQTFAATVGIDDCVRPAGNVIFVVRTDGQEVFRSDPLTGRNEPVDVTVPLTGVSRLTLIVELGAGADIGDCADWAAARLIKPQVGK